jgi:hypothetical protein
MEETKPELQQAEKVTVDYPTDETDEEEQGINPKKSSCSLATQLERVFILKDKGQDIKRMSQNHVRREPYEFYNMYYFLTTAKVSAPQIKTVRLSPDLKA